MKKRWEEILNLIDEFRSLSVNEFSEKVGVSEVTIRKDLNILEKKGLLMRSHGGASVITDSTVPSFSIRESIEEKEKQSIALAASQLIDDGDSVFIDAGTTPLAVASLLVDKSISIITNSIPVGMQLSNFTGNVSLTSGEMLKESMALYGPDTEEYINKLQVNKLILGTSGVRLDTGLTTSSSIEASAKKSMVQSARKVIAVLDHSKFNKMKSSLFAHFNEIDVIVTSTKVPKQIINLIEDKGVEVITVDDDYSHKLKLMKL